MSAAAGLGAGLLISPNALAKRIGYAEARASKFNRDWSGTNTVLLGTGGGPIPMHGRNMTSQAVVVNGSTYMIDCGAGVVRQLVDAGIPYGSIKALFITHLHSDHVNDYFPTIVSGRRIGAQPGFSGQVQVFGPGPAGQLPVGVPPAGVSPVNPMNPTTGTVDLSTMVLDAFAYTVNQMYIKSASGPDIREIVVANDINVPNVGAGPHGPFAPAMDPFSVYEDRNVKVSAILVNHPPVYPSFGFRFDTADGSVVFSGDGLPSQNVVRLARGADLLVHEVMYGQAMIDSGFPPEFTAFLRGTHTDVTEVGRIATEAGVEQLALSHIIPINPSTPYGPTLRDSKWIRAIRPSYDGPVTVGADLMRLRVNHRHKNRGHLRR